MGQADSGKKKLGLKVRDAWGTACIEGLKNVEISAAKKDMNGGRN
jgi:hypothetical protein